MAHSKIQYGVRSAGGSLRLLGLLIGLIFLDMQVGNSQAAAAVDLSLQTPPATQAAEPQHVNYGQPTPGEISTSTYQEVWIITAGSKDRLTITVTRTGGTLVPALELRDEQGNVLAKADHDSSFAKAVIPNFTLPNPGRYALTVGRYKGASGKTTGQYNLIVSLLGLGADGINPTFVEGQIQLGQSRDGSISEAKWQDSWAFQTTGNGTVTITVNRLRGTLVPTVTLSDSNWKQVATGTLDETFATTNIAQFTPTGSGPFYVTIGRLDATNGGTVGDYRLLVVQSQ